MCTEISSPRISFSLDLTANEDTEVRRDTALVDTDMDFEFNVDRCFEHEPYPADLLFENGVILPSRVEAKDGTRHKKIDRYGVPPRVSTPSTPPLPPRPRVKPDTSENRLEKEIISDTVTVTLRRSRGDQKKKNVPKSFWGFKRSLSLNYDIKNSLMCTFPLLSRSNSTGSFLNPKSATLKQTQKQGFQTAPLPSTGSSRSSPQSTSWTSLCSNVSQVLPNKRTGPGSRSRSGNTSSSIRPFFNLPPYVPRMGIGSILRNPKDKKKKSFKL